MSSPTLLYKECNVQLYAELCDDDKAEVLADLTTEAMNLTYNTNRDSSRPWFNNSVLAGERDDEEFWRNAGVEEPVSEELRVEICEVSNIHVLQFVIVDLLNTLQCF